MNITNLSKSAALIFLYIIGLTFTFVVAYQMIYNLPLNPFALGIVGALAGNLQGSVSTQHGVNVTNDTVAKTASAQYPLGTHSPDNVMVAPTLAGATHTTDDNLVAQHLANEAAMKDNKA